MWGLFVRGNLHSKYSRKSDAEVKAKGLRVYYKRGEVTVRFVP
jgi:hypothetical protein